MIFHYKVSLQQLPWEKLGIGAQQKSHQTKENCIRILRLDEHFEEKDWCTSGHMGYVLAGQMDLHFEDKLLHFKAGDALILPAGKAHQHKAVIPKGGFVELLLIESLEK